MNPENPSDNGAAIGLPPHLERWLQSAQDVQRLIATGLNEDGSLKPQTIFALLRAVGSGLSEMAEELGVSAEVISMVIRRIRTSRRIQDAIAAKFGMPADRLWGRR